MRKNIFLQQRACGKICAKKRSPQFFFAVSMIIVLLICNTACGSVGGKAGTEAGNGTDETANEAVNANSSNTAHSAGKAGDSAENTPLDLGKEDHTRISVAVSIPENRFIETAAANFQKSNPGIAVEVKYYTTMGETITKRVGDAILSSSENTDPGGEKYLKTISTELMSGAGPDIIDTFYIPGSRYADNGFLCDLDRIIDQDKQFNKSNYYENIINGSRYKGGLFTMPIAFAVSLITGKYGLPASVAKDRLTLDIFFKSAGDALKAHGIEDPTVLHCRQKELFYMLFNKSYSRFVDEENKKCNFTSDEFIKMIKQIKEAADKKLITGSKKNKSWNSLDIYMLSGIESDSNIVSYYENPQDNKDFHVYPIPVLDGKSYLDARILMEYGINNNSKSKGAAWKFIEYLLSEEMQTSPELYAFPINKEAVAEKSKREKWPETKTLLTAGDPAFSQVNVLAKINWQIYKIAEEETDKYFNGQRTAEETANIIQGRIDVVINE